MPKTVVLTLARQNLTDALPDQSTHVLQPGEQSVLRALRIEGVPWRLSYNAKGLLGVPRESTESSAHRLPFPTGTRAVVTQIFGASPSSHTDVGSRHAIDFAVPLGTPVVASQAGVVARVKDGSVAGGLDPSFQGLENLVVVYHADDTWSVYGHLQAGSIAVKLGETVAAGQFLARTGHSGMMGGPHLHFALQMRSTEGIVSIPVRFETPVGQPLALHYAESVTVQ